MIYFVKANMHACMFAWCSMHACMPWSTKFRIVNNNNNTYRIQDVEFKVTWCIPLNSCIFSHFNILFLMFFCPITVFQRRVLHLCLIQCRSTLRANLTNTREWLARDSRVPRNWLATALTSYCLNHSRVCASTTHVLVHACITNVWVPSWCYINNNKYT